MTEQTEVEQEELSAVEVAEETFLGDVVTIILEELKAAKKLWSEMSETEQDTVLHRLQSRAVTTAKKAINIIASKNNPTIHAQVESVTFKGGIKAVLQVSQNSPSRHDLADAEGGRVMLVVMNEEVLEGKEGMPEADKDQPELGLEEDPLFDEALQTCKELERITISAVQRAMKIGYNRAANLLDQLQRAGWISQMDSNGMRALTLKQEESEEVTEQAA